MPTPVIKPWIEMEGVSLHPDVTSENFSEDIFALDLGPLADGNPNVPAVYRDPEHFFRSSYLTAGLRSLLKDVLSRLEGGAGNRVLKLITAFGGGKSHTLAGLLHAAKDRKALDVIPEGKDLPRPGKVRTAVFDGQFFDATNGKAVPGEDFRARTMWGWIAWSLGGKEGYEVLRSQDECRVAPTPPSCSRFNPASGNHSNTPASCRPSITWPPARTSGGNRLKGTKSSPSFNVAYWRRYHRPKMRPRPRPATKRSSPKCVAPTPKATRNGSRPRKRAWRCGTE